MRRGGAARLDVGREADADVRSVTSRLRLLLEQLWVLDLAQREIERRRVVATVVRERNWRLIRELVGRDEIQPAERGRIHPQLVRGEIDEALYDVGRFRTARAPIRADRRRV